VEVRADGYIKVNFNGDGKNESHEWAKQCLDTMCAMRTGYDVYNVATLIASGSKPPPLTCLNIPESVPKDLILGKDGSRLMDLCEAHGVIGAFAAKEQQPTEGDDVSMSTTDAANKLAELEAGMKVECKYGAEWFEATLVEVNDTVIKVTWGFDGSEDQVVKAQSHVRVIVEEQHTILLWGGLRGRLEVEMNICNIVELKEPGKIAAPLKHHAGSADMLYSFVRIQVEGKARGRIIGKGGSVKQRISKLCGSTMEYIVDDAHMIGSAEERARTEALLQLVEMSNGCSIKAVPDVLQAFCEQVLLPKSALSVFSGFRRDAISELEDETGTFIFNINPTPLGASTASKKTMFQEGMVVEGKCRGEWLEATVVKVTDWGGDDEDDDTDGRILRLKWSADGKEAEVPAGSVRENLQGAAADERKKKEALEAFGKVAILGPEAQRRDAHLRLLDLVEVQQPGTFQENNLAELLGAKVKPLTEQEAAQCRESATRERLSAVSVAAKCVLGNVGNHLCLMGVADAVKRGHEFTRLALAGSPVSSTLIDTLTQSSFSTCMVSKEKSEGLTAYVVAPVEKETETMIFLDDSAAMAGLEKECRVVVCGHDPDKIASAIQKVNELDVTANVTDGGWNQNENWDKAEASDNQKWNKQQEEEDADASWGEKWGEKSKWDQKGSEAEEKSHNDTSWEKAQDAKWKQPQKWEETKNNEGSNDKAGASWGAESKWKKSADDGSSDGQSWNAKAGQSDDGKWGSGDTGEKTDWTANRWDQSKAVDEKTKWKDEKDWRQENAGWQKKQDSVQSDDTSDKWRQEESWQKSKEPRHSNTDVGWDKKSTPSRSWKEEIQDSEESRRWDKHGDANNGKSWLPTSQESGVAWSGNKDRDSNRWPESREEIPRKLRRLHDEEPHTNRCDLRERLPPREGASPSRRRPGSFSFGGSSPTSSHTRHSARVDAVGALPSQGSKSNSIWGSIKEMANSREPGKPPWRAPPSSRRPDGGAYVVTDRRRREDEAYSSERSGSERAYGRSVRPSSSSRVEKRRSHRPSTERTEVKRQKGPLSDPRTVLRKIGFPQSVDEWAAVQTVVWEHHRPLPRGWIRLWSRTQDTEYYLRKDDNYSTFELDEVFTDYADDE